METLTLARRKSKAKRARTMLNADIRRAAQVRLLHPRLGEVKLTKREARHIARFSADVLLWKYFPGEGKDGARGWLTIETIPW